MNEQKKEYGLVLDIHSAIEYSGLSKALLYRLAREEETFPSVRIGGRIFFNRDGLVEWLTGRTGN